MQDEGSQSPQATGAQETGSLNRTIGLPGAVFVLVGYVVGASIFILPGELAASTGPSVFVSYLIAAFVALFACVATAQISSAFPTSGAIYVAISRVLSPLWGFVYVWLVMLGVAVGIPLVAYGFANYLAFIVPGLSPLPTALGVVVFFAALNVLGVRIATWAQALMVVGFVAVLLVFGVGGLLNSQPGLMTPLFPNGLGPVVTGAIVAYFSYAGFTAIAEVGGEVRQPGRNIPLAIGLGFLAVLVLYTLVPAALTGVLPWDGIGTDGGAGEAGGAALATASATFLPGWFATVVAISALFAAATSVNGILLAQSRSLFAVARDRVVPGALARVSPRFGTPVVAILLMAALSVLGVLVGAGIEDYAIVTVLCFMVFQVLTGAAVLLLPRRIPEHFGRAPFRLGRLARWFFGVGLIATSSLFILIGISESLVSAAIFAAFLVAGVPYFFLRRKWLMRQGVDIEAALRGESLRIPTNRDADTDASSRTSANERGED